MEDSTKSRARMLAIVVAMGLLIGGLRFARVGGKAGGGDVPPGCGGEMPQSADPTVCNDPGAGNATNPNMFASQTLTISESMIVGATKLNCPLTAGSVSGTISTIVRVGDGTIVSQVNSGALDTTPADNAYALSPADSNATLKYCVTPVCSGQASAPQCKTSFVGP